MNLDIAWIKEKLPTPGAHQAQLPSMYHQFMQLAGRYHKEPWNRADNALRDGRIRVDGDSQMSTIPGLFACGECAPAHGANRLGETHCRTECSESARGEFAANSRVE
jgi:succinate dehydrogenase / fumarate reductase flavoprotein subunit